MKNILKKVLFPFFRARHHFLSERWWFRALAVIYVCIFFFSMSYMYFTSVKEVYDNCLESSNAAREEFGGDLAEGITACSELASNARTWPGILQESIANPIIYHYLFQFIFFKVVIDFIALGGRKRESGRSSA